MRFREANDLPWQAVGSYIYAEHDEGLRLVAIMRPAIAHEYELTNGIADHVCDLHNANLTKRTITASGAARAAAERS